MEYNSQVDHFPAVEICVQLFYPALWLGMLLFGTLGY